MKKRVLTPGDIDILRAVNRYRFLTAGQLNRLMWPNNTRDEGRYAQLRISRLVPDGHLLCLEDLPRPRKGRRPNVYALGWRGRQALQALGDSVEWYYRPSETRVLGLNPFFMQHTLEIIDVLIAAQRLAQDLPDVQLTDVVMERELRRWRMQAVVPGVSGYTQTRTVTVVPDALFTLEVQGVAQHFVLEVDRDTEHRRVWQDKVAALTYWLLSPDIKMVFSTDLITVMVVTPGDTRRDALRAWTEKELRERGLFDEQASMFMITAESPPGMTPAAFFAGRHWHPPYLGEPDNLINLPAVQPA